MPSDSLVIGIDSDKRDQAVRRQNLPSLSQSAFEQHKNVAGEDNQWHGKVGKETEPELPALKLAGEKEL